MQKILAFMRCHKRLSCFSLVGLFIIVLAVVLFPYTQSGPANLQAGRYGVAYSQYISAAIAGEAPAQTVIGNLYRLGLGVEQNLPEAPRWYLKAALQGYVPAQLNLAAVYMSGAGVPPRADYAFGWYSLAAKSGDAQAAAQLNFMQRRISITPNQMSAAKRAFANLETVRRRYNRLGAARFLVE